jgi:membrane protein implicated in regulation of membrane protease activity
MADTAGTAPTGGTPAQPAAPTGGPAAAPRLAPALVLYTLGRLAVFVVLVGLLWLVGLSGFLGLLLGLALSVPVSYLLLRPLRERVAEALAARSVARRTAKTDLRERLAGTDPDA